MEEKSTFVALFRESVIVQSVVTLLAVATLCTMYLYPLFRGISPSEIKVPEALMLVVGTILGYWFKTKSEYQAQKAVQDFAKGQMGTTDDQQ